MEPIRESHAGRRHTFLRDGDGANPHAAPIQGADGNLYGTTWNGGGPDKAGVIFRLALP
jgi:uncharacterized repeat protein (TIGR03803 family)